MKKCRMKILMLSDIGVEVEVMLQQAQKKGKKILVGIDEVMLKIILILKGSNDKGRTA